MQTSRLSSLNTGVRRWLSDFRRNLHLYEQINLAEWRHSGTQRALREASLVGVSGLPEADLHAPSSVEGDEALCESSPSRPVEERRRAA